jgi:hypothetical protein
MEADVLLDCGCIKYVSPLIETTPCYSRIKVLYYVCTKDKSINSSTHDSIANIQVSDGKVVMDLV